MADEEKTEEAAPAEGGKKLPIIIIVVLILVGLVLAGGISYFVTTQFMSDIGGPCVGGRYFLFRHHPVYVRRESGLC